MFFSTASASIDYKPDLKPKPCHKLNYKSLHRIVRDFVAVLQLRPQRSTHEPPIPVVATAPAQNAKRQLVLQKTCQIPTLWPQLLQTVLQQSTNNMLAHVLDVHVCSNSIP